MKRLIPFVLLLMLLGCAQPVVQTPEPAVSETIEAMAHGDISGEELVQLIGSDVIILDVRTPEEFQSGHVEGAINLPVDQFQTDFAGLKLDSEKTYALYCRSGNRSQVAYSIMEREGFTKLYQAPGVSQYDYPLVQD